MPLFDHFHLPGRTLAPWTSVHPGWAFVIAQHLNAGLLPPGFRALNQTHLGDQAQIDVAAYGPEDEAEGNGERQGAVATAAWAPPRPSLVVPGDFADLDRFGAQVFTDDEEMRLVAAVELVSPRNKDRAAARGAFVAKLASYLEQGVSVVLVDVVTDRRANFHADLMKLLDKPDAASAVASNLCAVAYRLVGEGKNRRLEMWPASLTLGSPLPITPLWISTEQAVPLDLEATYSTACDGLGIARVPRPAPDVTPQEK